MNIDPVNSNYHNGSSNPSQNQHEESATPIESAKQDEAIQAKPLINDEIFHLINSSKYSFPLLPPGARRQPGLLKYQNPQNNTQAFIIEDVHGSSITHEILSDVFSQIKDAKPEETLFILEGVRTNEVKNFNYSNSFHPNQICCTVANNSGADVINPVANQSQMSLVNEYITKAESMGFSRTQALGAVVASLVYYTPPSVLFNIPNSIEELSSSWEGKLTIQEIYDAVEEALDLPRQKTIPIITHLQNKNLNDWNTIESAIKEGVASKEEIIGASVIMYADENFQQGRYPDCKAAFNRAREMWGEKAPSFEEMHKAFISATTNNPQERNTKLGQILLNVQDRLTQEKLKSELKKRPGIKNIVSIAGYLHTGGIVPVLESQGYMKTT